MLNRLAIVIHWLGLAISLTILAVALTVYEKTGIWAGGAMDRGLLMILLPPFLGWLINFIISGHKSPLPWVANKETEQC